MKPESRLNARDYISRLAAGGHYHFSSSEAQTALGVSANAAKLALNRLAKQGLVASPARGFYVIVPPEYRSLGCLPADQFIPALMKRQDMSYYTGLLSAAQYHGAAHHRPQEYQVMVAKSRNLMAANVAPYREPACCAGVWCAIAAGATSAAQLRKSSTPP